jgi:hypothetical protein
MARGQIVNSIPDLQLDWASNHANKSVRDYLISVKNLSERQYRYVIGRCPKINWETRREEIQNRVSANKVERFIREASEMNVRFIKGANLALARANKLLMEDGITPSELVACATTIAKTQEIFLKAMGVSPTGLIQIFHELQKEKSQPSSSVGPLAPPTRTYEEMLEVIELYREQKKRRLAKEAAEPKDESEEPVTKGFGAPYSCLPPEIRS